MERTCLPDYILEPQNQSQQLHTSERFQKANLDLLGPYQSRILLLSTKKKKKIVKTRPKICSLAQPSPVDEAPHPSPGCQAFPSRVLSSPFFSFFTLLFLNSPLLVDFANLLSSSSCVCLLMSPIKHFC